MRYDVRHAETDRLDATGVDEHSADATDVAGAYIAMLETVALEGQCPAGTQREGCE